MEVKSYKCDICGKVYHVEEDDPSFVVIETSELSDDILKQQRYTCLCPKCQSYIKEYMGNPEIAETQYKRRRALSKLEDCIRSIFNRVSPFRSYWCGAGIENPEYFDELTEDIIKAIDERAEKYQKHMWVIRILSVLLGMCVGSALAQIIF